MKTAVFELFLSSLGLLLVTSLVLGAAEGAALSDSDLDERREVAKKELLILARLLPPLKSLARESEDLAQLVEHAAEDEDFRLDMAKRQGAWDMDYGWGGGRFGKRAGGALPSTSVSGKRYDNFGIAGRFGRSVDRVQNEGGH